MGVALLLVSLVAGLPQRGAGEPFVDIGVWYAGPGVQPPATAAGSLDELRRDLATIRRAGFNSVTTWVNWQDAEPGPGAYALTGVERIAAAAAEADLKVSVAVFVEPPPRWASPAQDADRFVDYLTRRLALQPGVLRVEKHARAAEPPARIQVNPGDGPNARLAMWSAIARGERTVSFAGPGDPISPTVVSLGETAGVVTRNQALFAPLRPRTGGVNAISGAEAGVRVDVRLLESADALVIVGLNHAPSPSTVTIAFASEIPEAIWQNMETGTAVNFVMGKAGPVLEHTFAPRDALVLMIRKKLR